MAVGVFPMAKLGALVLKQISKPLASMVKSRAKTSPFFRTYICMPPAQFYHWCEVKMKMYTMNLGKPVNIPKLNENMAIELGAELLGEGIIFVIAAGILVAEYTRSSRKELVKEEERQNDFERIQNELKELYFAKAQQEAQISELIRVLRMNIPTANFVPQGIDSSSIPEHHREGFVAAEQVTTMGKIKGWLWDAFDVILPKIDDDTRADAASRPIIIHTVVSTHQGNTSNLSPSPSSSNCDCPPSSSLDSINNKEGDNKNKSNR